MIRLIRFSSILALSFFLQDFVTVAVACPGHGQGEPKATSKSDAWASALDEDEPVPENDPPPKDDDDSTFDRIIRDTKPLTAVLFSTQDRNSFEVIGDAQGEGFINQNQSGDTGGILIAAESVFYDDNQTMVPVGAWFGVRLQTGRGGDQSDVDLALGVSLSYKRKRQPNKKILEGTNARLLLGVIYGDIVSLGHGVSIGDPFPLGGTIPVSTRKSIDFALGIGFRF